MSIITATGVIPAASLAPVAVLPQHQRSGIGSALIQHGLQSLRDSGERIVLLLGEPEYYTRFGFSIQKASHIISPFPPEYYMAVELIPNALTGVQGQVQYANAFGL